MKHFIFYILVVLTGLNTGYSTNKNPITTAPPFCSESYWQQHVDYQMEIDMDVNNLSI